MYKVPFEKSTDSSPANIRREIDMSLKRLKTDYIDMYQIEKGWKPFDIKAGNELLQKEDIVLSVKNAMEAKDD